MSRLSPQSRALLAATCDSEHISSTDKLRIRRKLDRRMTTGLALGAALTSGATTAEAAHSTLLATAVSWLPISAKIVGVVAIAGATTVGVARWSQSPPPRVESHSSVTAQSHTSKPSVAVVDNAHRSTAQAGPNATAVADERPRMATRSSRQNARSVPVSEPIQPETPTEAVSPLGAQVSAIRESRAAARRGDAQAALAALGDESLTSSKGALEQEAMLARVKGLCLQGDPVGARRVADQMLARYPDSLLSAHVRASCAFERRDREAGVEP